MNKVLEELAKWFFSILVLCSMALAVFSICILVMNYPYEFLIGLAIFAVVAFFRYTFFQ